MSRCIHVICYVYLQMPTSNSGRECGPSPTSVVPYESVATLLCYTFICELHALIHCDCQLQPRSVQPFAEHNLGLPFIVLSCSIYPGELGNLSCHFGDVSMLKCILLRKALWWRCAPNNAVEGWRLS